MNSERTEERARRARMHAALGDVHRLSIVELLASTDASSSELGVALDMPSNLLAHHLKTLEEAGLVTRRRSEGDRRRSYLSLNRHDGWLVPDFGAELPTPTARRVVFVCTANTARSHLAAALWRRSSPVQATSAGTHPGESINPGAIAVARRHRLDLPDVAPRPIAETIEDGDLVITVCDRAHEELAGAAYPHWSVPDPVPSGRKAAFEAAHDVLAERVAAVAPRFGDSPPDGYLGWRPSV